MRVAARALKISVAIALGSAAAGAAYAQQPQLTH
jgi:hypothetical protein